MMIALSSKSLKVKYYILACILFNSCANIVLANEIPVYEGAYDIQTFRLDNGGEQTSYKLNSSYPDMSAIDFYETYLVENGWMVCISAEDEEDNDWISFLQDHDGLERKVWQFLQYMLSSDRKTLIAVSLRYLSYEKNQNVQVPNPQYVYIVTYKNISDALINSLNLRCEVLK